MKLGSYQVSGDTDRSREEKTFADLTPEEREKCRKFWLKFRILGRLHWGSLFVPLFVFWALPTLGAAVPRETGIIIVAAFVISGIWLYNLDCPRCSAKFSGGLIALLPRVRYPWNCYGCELTRRELKYISEHAT